MGITVTVEMLKDSEEEKERLVKRSNRVAKLNLEIGALSARWPPERWVPSSFPSPFHLL